ncbi:MAG: MFS transporter, partial [Candidatus Hodarchaeota archaeon]
WEIGEILWIDAITFIIAVLPLFFLNIPSVRPKEKEDEEIVKTSFKDEFMEGITFIREKEGLLSLLSVFTGVNFFFMPIFVLLPLWVKSVNNGGAGELALLLACNSLGNLLGSVLMSTILSKGFEKKVHGVVGGLTLGYIGFFFLGLAPEGAFWFMAIGMFILGIDLPIANISSQTIWQTVVPPEKIGRVFSVRQTIAQISAPAGMILSGIIAEVIGIRTVYLAAATIGSLLLGCLWFFTGLPNVEKTLGIDFAEPTPILDKEVIAATSSEEIKEEKEVPDVTGSES